MSIDNLKKLREPFPEHQISKLPKPHKKDSPKGHCKECGGFHGLPATHLDYVGHAALTDRLLDTDPEWHWEPLAYTSEGLPAFDSSGGLWIKLTVCGVTRLGYGNAESKSYMDVGARDKEVIGDALRNAAMRFGAALELWHKGDLHKEQDDDSAAKAKPTVAPEDKEALEACNTIADLQAVFMALPKERRAACNEIKDAVKTRLSAQQNGSKPAANDLRQATSPQPSA